MRICCKEDDDKCVFFLGLENCYNENCFIVVFWKGNW